MAKRSEKSKGGKARKREKFPGLHPELHPRVRWEYMDADYVSKLSEEEKKFYSDFIEEYYGANFHHAGKKLYRKKKDRRARYNENNARNRDTFAILRTKGWIEGLEEHIDTLERITNPGATEDNLVEILDSRGKKTKNS